MGDYGIKISKPGTDVNKAEPKDLVYSSAYNTLKVAQSGKVTASGSTVTISHSLGYKPTYLAYVKYVSNSNVGYRLMTDLNSYVTDSDLVCEVLAATDIVSYFIFYDPLDTSVTEFTRTKDKQYGMKISQEGEDVNRVSDTKTSFNSEYNTLQIQGIYTLNGATANSSVTVAHSFGYKPAFLADVKRSDGAGGFYYETLPYYVDAGASVDQIICESQNNQFEVFSGDEDNSSATIRILAFTESLE